jgi:hypothetical protein
MDNRERSTVAGFCCLSIAYLRSLLSRRFERRFSARDGAADLVAFSLITSTAIIGNASPAHAGDDSTCIADQIEEYPKEREQQVPLNPILVYRSDIELIDNAQELPASAPSLHLEDTEGNSIQVVKRILIEESPGCLPVYTPKETLLPNTDYFVRFSAKTPNGWSGHSDIKFTTGDAVDSTPPRFTVGADQDSGWGLGRSSKAANRFSSYRCERAISAVVTVSALPPRHPN